MRSANQVNVMFNCEFAHDSLTEGKADTPIVVAKLLDTALRVTPQQVAQEAGIGHISWSNYIFYLFEVLEFWTEAAVHAQNFLVNDCTDGQTVENVRENLPQFDRVSTLALIVEAVDSINLGAFVIASQKEEIFGELYFVAEQKRYRFDRLLAAVDIVTQEQVVRLRGEPSVLENSEQVVILTVHITANLDRCLKLEQIWLADEDLSALGAQVFKVIL